MKTKQEEDDYIWVLSNKEAEIILQKNVPQWTQHWDLIKEGSSRLGQPFEDRDYSENFDGNGHIGRHYKNTDGTLWSYFPDGSAYFQGHKYNTFLISKGQGWSENKLTGARTLLDPNSPIFRKIGPR